MKLRVVVLVLLLVVLVQAASKSSDFAGRWKFIAEKSKGGSYFPPDTTLVVRQLGSRMYFEYWANNHLFQRDEYRTDGKMEKLYTNANESVFLEGRLIKNDLQLTTHHMIEGEIGSQSFNDVDHWIVSPDGKTLTSKPSDGKTVVFQREEAAAPATPPPPSDSSSNPSSKKK